MDPCNRGEILTRRVQEKAANRTAVINTRAQVCERANRFIAHRSSDGIQLCASNFLGERTRPRPACAGFAAPRRELFPSAPRHSARDIHPVDWRGRQSQVAAATAPQKQPAAATANLQLSHPVRSAFANQHHDWSWPFSRPRVRGPFRPIWCSRSMGLDLKGPGSIGDVRNAASTQESSRAQTPVLLP